MGTGLRFKKGLDQIFQKVNRHNFLVKNGIAVIHNEDMNSKKIKKTWVKIVKIKYLLKTRFQVSSKNLALSVF